MAGVADGAAEVEVAAAICVELESCLGCVELEICMGEVETSGHFLLIFCYFI